MKNIFNFVLITTFFVNACVSKDTQTQTPVTTFTPIATFTSTIILPTSTITQLPTITPTLNPIRSTPPTIMLHRPNMNFDSFQFLKDLILILQQGNMKVITYRDIYQNPSITATEKGRLFIITIDDIYLRYPIDPKVLEMIRILREANYPAVLGVITENDYAYPETASLLKELVNEGWEIATHTNNHDNLGEMERTAPRAIRPEIILSMDRIENAIGTRPITLILPYGQMIDNAEPLKKANVYWVVGINGGITYNSQNELIYVGRESPATSAIQTYKNLKARFGF